VFLNLTCDDGYVNELYLLNKTELNHTLFELNICVELFYSLTNLDLDLNFIKHINMDLVYAGIGAERLEVTYITQYVVKNDTSIPEKVPIVRFVNPYYKFYILLNGIRVGYPIQVGYEDQNGRKVLKYLRMFIPRIGANGTYTIFTINYEYLEKITELFNNITGYNVSMNHIVIGDIYYYPTRDLRYLSPVLVLYANNTDNTSLNKIVVMRLYPDKPVVESVFNVLGQGYSAGDILALENSILHVIATGERRTVTIPHGTHAIMYRIEYYIIGVCIFIVAVYLMSRSKKLRRLYRESLKK